jgi:hypothetical protein
LTVVPLLPTPWGEALRRSLQDIDDRLSRIEAPQQPGALFQMASTSLTTANAGTYTACQVYCPDLTMTAFSNGHHWFRSDTGAQII